jgi:geranylgeranyl pyrophosphate synthase
LNQYFLCGVWSVPGFQGPKEIGQAVRVRTVLPSKTSNQKNENTGTVAWWFAQGFYHVGGVVRHFMLSFFRTSEAEDHEKHRHILLMSILKEGEEKPQNRTWIEPGIIDDVQEYLNREGSGGAANLDRHMARAVLLELVEYGPPTPIEVRSAPKMNLKDGFQAEWEDIQMVWKEREVSLSFREPESDATCRLVLTSKKPLLDLRTCGAPRLERTTYLTFPRMELRGRCGEEAVEGMGWFDHQTAGMDEWFVMPEVPVRSVRSTDDESARLLGWDWLGANMDDGSDWIVICHRDMETRHVVEMFAIIRNARGETTLERDFEMTPVRSWTSASSHIQYPISWRFNFPNQNIDFVFDPTIDDQEIRIAGVGRNIWEGTGTLRHSAELTGSIGRGRLELNGYGLIFDVKQYSEGFVERIDRHMAAFLPRSMNETSVLDMVGPPTWKHDSDAYSEAVSRPVWDLIDRGGKHWRPMFGLLLLETLGVPSGPYEELISNVIELNHDGSLIIDDIEDQSTIRRGAECIHRRYGIDVAINAGNTLYFLPYLLLNKGYGLSDQQLVELYRIIVRFQVRAHFGQGQDIQWQRQLSRRWLEQRLETGLAEQALQMYAMKTGAATEGMSEAACVIAGAPEKVRSVYAHLGRTFGAAFQVMDDVLNFSTSPDWTKLSGEDLAAGKPTYVIIRALEMLSGARQYRLMDILGDERLRGTPEGFAEGVALVRSSGALEEARQFANDILAAGWRSFSEYAAPSEAKSMLRMLTAGLLKTEEDN